MTDEKGELAEGFRILPKLEIHAHFRVSMRVSTVEELLVVQGWVSSDAKCLAQAMVIPRDADGVPLEPSAFEGFFIVKQAQINTPALCRWSVREFLEDCASDGMVYAELRTGGEDLESVRTIIEGFAEAKDAGIDCVSKLILSIKRDKPAHFAHDVVSNSIVLKDLIPPPAT